MDLIYSIPTIFLILSLAVYYFLRRQQELWLRLGLPVAVRPHLLFGNLRGIGQTEHSCYLMQRLYWEFKRQGLKLGGFMSFIQPAILIVDPELVKCILVKDFNNFHDRGIFSDTVGDPLSGGLFNLEGFQWKTMRQKLTPAFSSGKMKYMFGGVINVAQDLKKFMAENYHRDDLEIKDVLQRFTMDVIGRVAFGIEFSATKKSDSEFKRMATKALDFDVTQLLILFLGGRYKTLLKNLGVKLLPKDVTKFFMELARNTVALRENSGLKRNDFMDLLLEIRDQGKVTREEMTIREIAAQCFVFLTAGIETSSATMNFCMYELVKNLDIQEKLRLEFEDSIARSNGELTYEALMSMELLDRVVSETLRKYPPLDNLIRVSSTAYTIPDTKLTVPAGTAFQIPVYAMHHDPEYFPDPDRFDPERFRSEIVRTRPSYCYLPFGAGPRNCIGLRFGLMQTKIGLVTLLRDFRFSENARTHSKLAFDPTKFLLAPQSGMYFKIEPVRT
ncbi:probable cytochrome P450 6a13 [Malaya genurostris]|uniref:probable cytochrome P450 6a13 n=1 Tax=Malaya genurostris TaxID=325434 RepID=UPI0026F4029B|nr:probable cytochrome P450 6a13 [Malaya genurostris]